MQWVYVLLLCLRWIKIDKIFIKEKKEKMTLLNTISKNPTLFSMSLCCLLHVVNKNPKRPPFSPYILHVEEYKPKIEMMVKPKPI